MKLRAPYTGGFVDAQGELAERLMAHGYKPVGEPAEKPEEKSAPRKRAPKKEQ